MISVAPPTGPESATKSSLCTVLAQRCFSTPVVAEYVREGIVPRQRNACCADVEPIARTQCQRANAEHALAPPPLLLDTDLHCHRLWSQVLFGRSPAWIDAQLAQAPRYDAVFLRSPEGLPWQADGLRCQRRFGAAPSVSCPTGARAGAAGCDSRRW